VLKRFGCHAASPLDPRAQGANNLIREGATLVFVEVRFRRPSRFGGGALSVDANKRRKIARASQAWLSSHRQYSQAGCRFDVVAAMPGADGIECEWIRAAFTLDDLW